MSKIVKSLPLHIQVYNLLREDIISGNKVLGEKISEIKISEELGVSRSPVREALRMLENEGFVLNTQNGVVVYPLELEDVKELYECRIATEPYAAFLATTMLGEKELAELFTLVDRAEHLQNNRKYDEVAEVNTEFHMRLINACGNKRLIEMIEKFYSLIILGRNADLKEFGPRDCLVEHRAILEAVREKDPQKAEILARKHLEHDWMYFIQSFKTKKV